MISGKSGIAAVCTIEEQSRQLVIDAILLRQTQFTTVQVVPF